MKVAYAAGHDMTTGMSNDRANTLRRGLLAIALGAASLVAHPIEASPADHLASLRRDIEQRVDQGPKHRLSKAEIRPRLKVAMRLVHRCYDKALLADPKISGVVNTRLAIRNDPTL